MNTKMKITKMKIKRGDTVKILSGKDKGKTGKVLLTVPALSKVVVENVNLHTHFERSKQAGQPGTKVVAPSPLHISKVQLMDDGNGSRVGYKFLENGNKQRVAKKSGKAI